MTQRVITHKVTHTVTLGSGGYGDALRIANGGSVAPTVAGAYGVVAPGSLERATIVNAGIIRGGPVSSAGGSYVTGGIGVDFLAASGAFRNDGLIVGGGPGPQNEAGPGGIGVFVGGDATVSNGGTIAGGSGGVNGDNGGVGVMLNGNGNLANSGLIKGGAGSAGYYGGDGAVGLVSSGLGTITNDGTVSGGHGGEGQGSGYSASGYGGSGVELDSGATLVNHGLITDGAAAPAGGVATAVIMEQTQGLKQRGATLINTGTITAHQAGNSFREGGFSGADAVAVFSDGLVENTATGTLAGGAGGVSGYAEYGAGRGGTGLFLYGSTLRNAGLIEGGAGGGVSKYAEFNGGTGGVGVVMDAGAARNTGQIAGGHGGDGRGRYGAGFGGDGLDATGGSIINLGLITGGDAGRPGEQTGVQGGGAGVSLSGGAELTNMGTIEAGSSNGNGFLATGAVLNGATLVDSGTIAGGGPEPDTRGFSVEFAGASTLVLAPQAVLDGAIDGFGQGDLIDLAHFAATRFVLTNEQTLTLYGGPNGSTTETLIFAADYKASGFTLRADGHGGTDLTYSGTERSGPGVVHGGALPNGRELVGGMHLWPTHFGG